MRMTPTLRLGEAFNLILGMKKLYLTDICIKWKQMHLIIYKGNTFISL